LEDLTPVDVLLAEMRRHARPLVLVSAAIECVAAAATIASAVPPWAAGAILAGVPLGSLGLYERRRATLLKEQISQLYHFDRKYTRYVSRWTLGSSERQGYLSGTHHGERDLVALRPIRKWTWNISRRSDGDLPFSDAPPVLRNKYVTRSGSGTCSFRDPHRQASSLAFRIEFDPMLRPGERVSLSFDLEVPVYKPATLELLRARPSPTVPTPGEADFTSADISFPIDSFVKELVIPECLESRRHGLQVLLRDNEFAEESELISSHSWFSIDRPRIDNEVVWRLRLERYQPPIRATYRLYWEPPPSKTE
jgi:hypothetical protein